MFQATLIYTINTFSFFLYGGWWPASVITSFLSILIFNFNTYIYIQYLKYITVGNIS